MDSFTLSNRRTKKLSGISLKTAPHYSPTGREGWFARGGGFALAEQSRHPRRARECALVLHWPQPPVRRIRCLKPHRVGPLELAPPWLPTGPADQPFDFSGHLRRLLQDIVQRTPELRHIRVPEILIGVTQARSARMNGVQARVTPLRFPRGELTRVYRGVPYQVQRYLIGSEEFLYLMTFSLPRFLDREFDDKLVTVLHELYHIGTAFDGDLRRHGGRYQLHTHSQRCYDEQMRELARAYLASSPEPALHAFLRLSFAQLHERHGAIHGVVVPRPRIVPLLGQAAQIAHEPIKRLAQGLANQPLGLSTERCS
jgi:Putative phage metallopeptidase